jgi:branched-chain amino acid transport system permease protein
MEILQTLFLAPFLEIYESPAFFAEVVTNGILTGILYSLVALGYVIIFKASGVFNFAQGAMVLFAPLTLVGLMELGTPFPIAFIFTIIVMVALAMLIEWSMLRRLVNQDGMILFMATIGLSFVLEGSSQIIWGSDVKRLDIGLPDQSLEIWGMLLNSLDLLAAAVAIIFVGSLTLLFRFTATGRALRAVADDHQAALSIGIPLEKSG